jgi:hypothetical protein
VIGEATAMAAAALANALVGYLEGGSVTPTAKTTGGSLVAELYRLREATMGELEFEQVARTYGLQALRAKCNGSWGLVQGEELIDETLAALARVAEAMSH